MSSDGSLGKGENVGKYLNVCKDAIYCGIESKQMPAVRPDLDDVSINKDLAKLLQKAVRPGETP